MKHLTYTTYLLCLLWENREVDLSPQTRSVSCSGNSFVPRGAACRTGVIFLRILGEKRRERGEREASAEREAQVACEERSAPPLARDSRFALASFRFYSPKIRKNSACSAGSK